MLVNASMLRLTWTAIEETSTIDLLNLSDTMLIKLVLQQVSAKIALSGEEVCALYSYLASKLLLIRDMAEFRQDHEQDLFEVANLAS